MILSEELVWRGLIKDATFNDPRWLDEPKIFYLGIDASSDSLTVGNLAIVMLARRLAKNGWKAVLLMGGATSLIGDPGGKKEERRLKSREEIINNISAIKREIDLLFDGQPYTPVDNYDWFKKIGYLDFLRDVGKHYSITELVQREFVTERIREGGSGISYAEFSYSLIQGYDYWYLHKHHGVTLQIGGSDQWGNMLSGVPLIRKKENKQVHAMSMPLVVNKVTGIKFGKTEEGAVWLDSGKTSVTQFYQFWVNSDDSDVEDYLKIFTELSKDEVEKIMATHQQNPAQRIAQNKLAEEVTAIVHGNKPSKAASEVTKYLTSQVSIASASNDDLEKIRREVPYIKVDLNTHIRDALVKTGLANSGSDARRLIESGAVYINGSTVNEDRLFKTTDFLNGRLLLRRGKAFKDTALIETT